MKGPTRSFSYFLPLPFCPTYSLLPPLCSTYKLPCHVFAIIITEEDAWTRVEMYVLTPTSIYLNCGWLELFPECSEIGYLAHSKVFKWFLLTSRLPFFEKAWFHTQGRDLQVRNDTSKQMQATTLKSTAATCEHTSPNLQLRMGPEL